MLQPRRGFILQHEIAQSSQWPFNLDRTGNLEDYEGDNGKKNGRFVTSVGLMLFATARSVWMRLGADSLLKNVTSKRQQQVRVTGSN